MTCPARAALAACALFLAACDAGAQSTVAKESAGAKKMIQLTNIHGLTKSPINAPRHPLRPGSPVATPSATPVAGPGYTRPFANESQNSRLPAALGTNEWKPLWNLPLDPAMPARFVLAIGDRAIVHGRQWHLVDAATGRSISNDRLGGGPIVIDQALKGFITHYTSAHLSVRRLADGKELFKYLPGQGDVYTRAFLTRHGGRLLILGWERALDPHGRKKAENSRVEIIDLGMPPKADSFGFLSSSSQVGELYIKELGVQMATAGPTIVAAARNEFYRMTWDLQVTEILEGNFDPQGLSLDEAGNTYMAVAAGGTNHVWKISPKGEIAYDFTLPGPGIVLETPPIVGYDHTVYQLAGPQIYAVGENGKLRWSRTAEGAVGGAAISGDGQLLVSEGACVVAYDAKGDRRKVHCFPNETLTSPPILNESGHLLVTSKTALHCLQGVGK